MMVLEAAGDTNVGSVRKHNEDSYLCDKGLGLFIVADGLGGHAAGEIASKIVVDRIRDYIAKLAFSEAANTAGFDCDQSTNAKRLKAAIHTSDKAIAEDIAIHPERDTMGSTVVACLFEGRRVTLAHVGDSRAYLLEKGVPSNKKHIQQMTRDHSWVAEQVANGILTEEEAKRHPFRNVITQALGNGSELNIEIQEFDITDNQAILLCSDGLSGMVSDDKIFEIFNQASNLRDAVQCLISQAIENGGEDNVSVVMVSYSSLNV